MTRDPRFSGFRLTDGRRGGFVWDEKPFCVNVLGDRPHRLLTRDNVVLNDTVASCHFRPARGTSHCGATLYIAQMTFGGSARAQGSGERAWLVVEITREHIERMRRQPMLMLERLHLIGVALPGVDLHFPPSSE
jgi:hypothetical protein